MSIANLENVVSNAERRALSAARRGSCRGSPTWRFAAASSRGKLELTMNEDEGHEDKLIHRIIDEAVKNIFGQHFDVREFRPMVDYFESGQSVEIGDMLPAKAVLERIAKVPGLRKRAEEIGRDALARPQGRDARDAATASAAEFILEGLHVHNKLNKTVKAGRLDVHAADRPEAESAIMSMYRIFQVGRHRRSSSPSRPTRSSTSSPSTSSSTARTSCGTWKTSTRTRCPRSSS